MSRRDALLARLRGGGRSAPAGPPASPEQAAPARPGASSAAKGAPRRWAAMLLAAGMLAAAGTAAVALRTAPWPAARPTAIPGPQRARLTPASEAASHAPPAAPAEQAAGEEPPLLLRRALHLEQVAGDAPAAVAAYRSLLERGSLEPHLAAVAELRLATLLDRMGRVQEAARHHRHIVESYGDDPRLADVVRLARAGLGAEAVGSRPVVARRLWEGSDAYAYGSLSPDGSFLAFVDWSGGRGNLAIHDLDRGLREVLRRLDTGGRDSYACSTVVGPGGRRVAYTWYTPAAGHEVHIVDRDGSHDHVLTRVGHSPRHLELVGWSEDGRELLAVVYRQGGNYLATISTTDGAMRNVHDLGLEAPEVARLSPDGRWVAYHKLAAGLATHDVVVAATDGSSMHTVVDHPANDLLPVWTPDGRHLLFVSDRTGTLGAWVVEVVDGEPRGGAHLLKPDFGRSIPMGFTQRGDLVYALQASISDIFTARIDAASGRLGERVASSGRFVGVNSSPVWSPDGNRLAYLSERGPLPAGFGPTALVIRDRSGSERVLTPGLRRVARLRWHPNGREVLLFGAYEGTQQALYAIDVDSGRTVVFAALACDCAPVYAVSPGGRDLAYLRADDLEEEGVLVVRDLRSGRERVLAASVARSDLRALEYSPDGTRLLAALRLPGATSWSLLSYPVTQPGGEPDVIADLGTDPDGLGIVGWSADARALVYLHADPGGRTLRRVSLDTRADEVLLRRVPTDLRDVRLHPDGATLVYASGQYRAEIWLLENALGGIEDREPR